MPQEQPQTPAAEAEKSRWIRRAPSEAFDANRPLLKRLDRWIKQEKRAAVLEAIADWPPADVMALLVHLPLKRARVLYGWLPAAPAVKVLAEIDPDLRAMLLEDADVARTAAIAEGLGDDDAIELLRDLPASLAAPVLDRLPHGAALRQRLAYPEDSAGAIMSGSFVAVLEDWPIGTATRMIRRTADEIDKLYEVYVVDEERRLIGRLKLRDLILNPRRTLVRDIMRAVPATARPDTDQEEVLDLAERHKLQTVPVLDGRSRVIGRVTVDELREVVRREADEDIKLMSGVAPDAQPDESLLRLVKGRLPWLVAGLLGASMAAVVVGSFEEDLERAAILASFIPVVMAMAGNAGIQASTVTVQGLAGGKLWIGDIGRRLVRELAGALVNGSVVALLLAGLILGAAQLIEIAAPVHLALAAGLSLATVTVMAATFGATIPLVLNSLKVDPAVATGVFITTSNDIFGVLIYFLMATTLYLGPAGLG